MKYIVILYKADGFNKAKDDELDGKITTANVCITSSELKARIILDKIEDVIEIINNSYYEVKEYNIPKLLIKYYKLLSDTFGGDDQPFFDELLECDAYYIECPRFIG